MCTTAPQVPWASPRRRSARSNPSDPSAQSQRFTLVGTVILVFATGLVEDDEKLKATTDALRTKAPQIEPFGPQVGVARKPHEYGTSRVPGNALFSAGVCLPGHPELPGAM